MVDPTPKLSTDMADVKANDVQNFGDPEGPTESFEVDEGGTSWASKLLRKIDWHLMPLMCVSYMIQFLDKQTLSQASLMGIIKDLNLQGPQFSWAGSIFYFGFLAFSYPASLLMVKFPIGKYLASNFFIWGVILGCHAATHSYTGLMIVRFLLGAAEASVSPGFSLITGVWYRRDEQPLRHGLWFAGNSVATAFSGLLAYGIAHIRNSLSPWKWLFLIYAMITVVWAASLAYLLPDSPSSARFLTEEERTQAVERVKLNQTGTINHKIEWDQVWEAFSDYKIWLLVLFNLSNNIPNGGLTTFNNLVMAGFGFSTLQVFLLFIPTGFIHAFFAIGRQAARPSSLQVWGLGANILPSTYLAGKFPKARCLLTAGCISVSLIGCILVYASDVKGAKLFGLFLFVAYAAGFPLSLSMVASNVAGYTKKATVNAMMFVAYCVGNILGPFFFFSREAPRYQSGFLAVIICFSAAIFFILTLALCWRMENARRDRRYGPAVPADMASIGGAGGAEDLTDALNTNFRYIY